MLTPTILLSLHNEFDDTVATLTSVSGENTGPFVVELTYNDPGICTVNVRDEISDMGAAFKRFTEIVQGEIQTVNCEFN